MDLVENLVKEKIEEATGIPVTEGKSKISPATVNTILKGHGFKALSNPRHPLSDYGYGHWLNPENDLSLTCGEVSVFWSIAIEGGVIKPLGTIYGLDFDPGFESSAWKIIDEVEKSIFSAATNGNGSGIIPVEFKHEHKPRRRPK